jgi:hypothetical protein
MRFGLGKPAADKVKRLALYLGVPEHEVVRQALSIFVSGFRNELKALGRVLAAGKKEGGA